MIRPAESYVIGEPGVWVPARVADVLLRDVLFEYRRRRRGDDRDVDAVLVALTLAALQHRDTSTPGRPATPHPDTSPPSVSTLSTRQAADRLGLTDRQVRRLIEAGRLPARRDRAGYVLDAADVDRLAHQRGAA